MEDTMYFDRIVTQTIDAEWLHKNHCKLDVLRLDALHDIISGNKWFKLKYYLEDAIKKGFSKIVTFGGAYSNHIIAVAYACKLAGLKSFGIIRGERPALLSHTLVQAKAYGMEFEFVNRQLYKNKEDMISVFTDVYRINEGGYGIPGAAGAKEILSYADQNKNYTHIVCAVGTGTMMAGLVKAASPAQKIIGISIMRGNMELFEKVTELLTETELDKDYTILYDYHFGGYAKHPGDLLNFMNEVWSAYKLPRDFVYTAKTFFAAEELILNHTIPPGSSILMIHSGGLQGNLSLSEGILAF